MGVDIHTKLIKYDPQDNLWHELELYRKEKNEYKKVYIFNGRNSEMFGIMSNEEEDDAGHFPCANIPMNSLDNKLKEEIQNKEYCYGFNEVLLSDMEAYLYKHPTITDYDEDWGEDWKPGDPKPQKTNPVKWIFDECIAYAEFAEGWRFGLDPYSRYKLLYWFSH